jgi:hypothetical protein
LTRASSKRFIILPLDIGAHSRNEACYASRCCSRGKGTCRGILSLFLIYARLRITFVFSNLSTSTVFFRSRYSFVFDLRKPADSLYFRSTRACASANEPCGILSFSTYARLRFCQRACDILSFSTYVPPASYLSAYMPACLPACLSRSLSKSLRFANVSPTKSLQVRLPACQRDCQ